MEVGMPTGYTAEIKDGIEFEKFVLQCARAFGALITMRDDPTSAPIPDEFKPQEWNKEKLEKAVKRLSELRPMSLDDARAEAKKEYDKALEHHLGYLKEKADLKVKYEDMLAKVREWQPPTPDHQGLKDFMIEQITGSIDFDCSTDYMSTPMLQSAEAWLSSAIERAVRDVQYHTREWAAEVGRCRSRTAWVRALKKSLERKAE
jgi:NADH:ubiquinone oxidoreductase subunit